MLPVFQDINQMKLRVYKTGGLNITGLRMVDFNNETVKHFINNGWKDLAKKVWLGAGDDSITVGHVTKFF